VSIDLVIVGGRIISCGMLLMTVHDMSGTRLALTPGFSTSFSFERAETACTLLTICGVLIPMGNVCLELLNQDKENKKE